MLVRQTPTADREEEQMRIRSRTVMVTGDTTPVETGPVMRLDLDIIHQPTTIRVPLVRVIVRRLDRGRALTHRRTVWPSADTTDLTLRRRLCVWESIIGPGTETTIERDATRGMRHLDVVPRRMRQGIVQRRGQDVRRRRFQIVCCHRGLI